ncbi:MAG: hypothetical protein V7K27_18280 [Nostoc sp.]|uniref:hypothetical protein n=1 Tax=Nostoc sp. TaxID=1180 RepID=UPI002FF84623
MGTGHWALGIGYFVCMSQVIFSVSSFVVRILDRFLRQLFKKTFWPIVCLIVLFGAGLVSVNAVQARREPPLWQVYQQSLKSAK